jgi:hypothetical protein
MQQDLPTDSQRDEVEVDTKEFFIDVEVQETPGPPDVPQIGEFQYLP